MNPLVKLALLMAVLSVICGCASYSAWDYRQNVANYGPKGIGYELDSNANYLDRHSLERHISMHRIKKLPVYGDSTGYRGFIFNECFSEAVDWKIYDRDGVVMGTGRLNSVQNERFTTQQYNLDYVADSLLLPPGKYEAKFSFLEGYSRFHIFHVPSPVDKSHGKIGHWHVWAN